MTGEDIVRLAAYLGLAGEEFRRIYLCGTTPMRFRKQRKKQCPFLLPDGCAVHLAKPLQCSSFPHWPELMSKTGRDEAAEYCPGINRGPHVDLKAAKKTANRVQKSFPELYDEPV